MIWLGIDPGVSGGVAMMADRGIEAVPLPYIAKRVDGRALRRWVVERVPLTSITGVTIEKAQAIFKPGGPGGKPSPGLATQSFSYGVAYGILVGVVEGWGVPLVEISPRKWQGAVIPGAKKGKTKEASVHHVMQAYPTVNLLLTPRHRKPHDGIADAVCIAEWCKLHSPFRAASTADLL